MKLKKKSNNISQKPIFVFGNLYFYYIYFQTSEMGEMGWLNLLAIYEKIDLICFLRLMFNQGRKFSNLEEKW